MDCRLPICESMSFPDANGAVPVNNKFDAIVIGAGHNGLTNGAYLARAGLNTLMVEKNDYIGGATVSRELYKKDWKL